MDTEKFKRIYSESRNGCNDFYRHPLCRNFAYSDGVKDLADVGCHWLLDILCSELPAKFRQNKNISNTCSIHVAVKKSKCVITAEFEDGHIGWAKKVAYTDMPEGIWTFYCSDDGEGPTPYRLILLTEY
jgi:hypothetical protein